MNNIYLVGFMGTGKTVVGQELARRKKTGFVDLDEVIVKKEGQPISDIFAQKGESYFRTVEKQALKEISGKNNTVVSCGGGIVLDGDNIALMRESGLMICLTATVDVILERTRAHTHRPLLNVAGQKEKIESLMKARSPFYARADMTIDTSRKSIKEVTETVLAFIAQKNE